MVYHDSEAPPRALTDTSLPRTNFMKEVIMNATTPVTGRELIYHTILNIGASQFRNRDIVEATGIGRQQVADCLAVLMREGVLRKESVYYNIIDLSGYVTFMMNRNLGKQELMPSKFLTFQPDKFELLLGSLLVIQNVPGADDWRTTGRLIKNEALDEITVAISTLQGYRKMLNTQTESGAFSQRVARDKKYAHKLQEIFRAAAEDLAGIELTGDLVIEYLRPRLRSFLKMGEDE